MEKAMIFKSVEEYERWAEQFEDCTEYEDIPVAIVGFCKVSLDLFTECKGWKTALNRFKKAFAGVDEEILGWVETMIESAGNGFLVGDAYSIEEIMDGCWHISLNILRA